MVVLSEGGQLFSMGMNRNGQLGRETPDVNYGAISPRSPKSKPVPEARHAWNVQSTPTLCQYQNTGVHQIAAGGEHTFVITESGELVAFGEGNHGQIGAPGAHAERSQATEYKAIKVPLEQQAREIACGIHHTVAVGKDGECYVWGDFSSSADHTEPTKLGVKAATNDWTPAPVPEPEPEPVPEPPPQADSLGDPGYEAYIIREVRAKLQPR